MSTSKAVTETLILQLREGVDTGSVFAGRDVAPGTLAYELIELGRYVSSQDGFIRSFWGTQVENPKLFIWSIDWESFEQHAASMNSEGYKDFMARASTVWDFLTVPIIMMHTVFTSDANAAREAPVTEVAFFTISKDAGDEKRTQLEDATMAVLQAAKDTANSSAFAVGWVFEDQVNPAATNSEARAFQAMLGWASVEEHIAFTATDEFAKTTPPLKAQMLPSTPTLDLFHVKFHSGA